MSNVTYFIEEDNDKSLKQILSAITLQYCTKLISDAERSFLMIEESVE